METTPQVRGRPFKAGNPGGPGRPKRQHELHYLGIMHRLLTPETWAAIIEKSIEQALQGDGPARAWLAKYCLPVECDPFADVPDGSDDQPATT